MKIAYFAPIYFDYLKQRPQHLAELLAKNHQVFYIEPTISLMRYLLKGGKTCSALAYDAGTNLRVIRANGVCTLHKSLEAYDILNLNTISEFFQLRHIVEQCDMIWVGYPGWYHLIKRFHHKKIVYDKMDEDSQIATNPLLRKVLIESEPKLIELADAVFVTCEKFYDRIKQGKRNVYLVRNGVSFDFAGCMDKAEPHEKKVFGYVGTISHWFDFEVLDTILEENSNNEIVLVGNNMMPEIKNSRIRYIGPVKKEKVAEYIRSFDVCLYNFKRTELLDTINPVKIYEYLALNKPVLAVRSQETEFFKGLLMVYESQKDVVQCLRQNIEAPFKTEQERKLFLEDNSWEARVQIIEKVLNQL